MQPISEATTSAIADRLASVRATLVEAARRCGRDPADITLIGVSKTKPVADVRAAHAAGLRDFGENYLQDALPKIGACGDLGACWHYIGQIQSNKTRPLADAFDWIHTIDRVKIARRLNNQCAPEKALNVCLQINIDDDPAKGGVLPDDAVALLDATLALSQLRVRGLMTILHPRTEPARGYGALRALFERLAPGAGTHWDSLSMGMSSDFEAAVAAGATHVRVGTAIFGRRAPRAAPA